MEGASQGARRGCGDAAGEVQASDCCSYARPAAGGAEATLNYMPSRQTGHNTARLRKRNLERSGAEEEEEGARADSPADVIVRDLEQRSLMMEDNPEAEELRREALRELPSGLTLKRSVRAALSASVRASGQQGARPLSLYKRAKYSVSFAWRRGWARAREAAFALEVWSGAISDIEGHFGSGVGSYFRMLRRLVLLNAALAALLLACTVLPQALHAPPALSLAGLTGEDSLLLFGHYSAGWVLGGRYYMPFAYLLTALAAATALCALLCYSTAASYRRHFIVSGGAQSVVFANKLFCGWDFGITAPNAAALNARQLYNELQELVRSGGSARPRPGLAARVGRGARNALVSALVLGGACGVLAGLHALLPRPQWELPRSLLITAAVALCPALLDAATRLEWRSARGRVYTTLARAWLLHSGLLLLLLVYWSRSGTKCWENRFAAEAYRLALLDAVVCLLVLPVLHICRALLHKVGTRTRRRAPQFSLAAHSLTLVYNQALVWFGLLFCPLLAALVALKLLLLFYVQRACLLRACQPPRKVWRAPQTQTVLSALVTLSLATALFAVGSLFLRMPSTECGPFREYDYVYMVVSEGVLRLSARPALSGALSWLTRPAVIAFLMLLLCVAVYYMRCVARAQRSTVRLLRRMLALQGTDKDFLLSAIHRVSNGEWLYSPRRDTSGGSGGSGLRSQTHRHTWRYLREVRQPANSRYQLEGARPPRAPPRSPAAAPEDGDSDTSFSWRRPSL